MGNRNVTMLMMILAGCLMFACYPEEDALQSETEPEMASEVIIAPTQVRAEGLALPLPPQGMLYHGVYPGGINGAESDLTMHHLASYEEAVGKEAAWVVFSHNWYEGEAFPQATAEWIRAAGSIPYVRLMMWSRWEQYQQEQHYSPQAIIDGKFDGALQAWCASAKAFGTPLLAVYGVEMNGEWFPWNARWNGAGTLDQYGDPVQADGAERFRDAYRHIIDTCRDEGADNITWIFHANYHDWPEDEWNRMELYYPGDDWMDWLAVSVYGAQRPLDDYCEPFRDNMDSTYERLATLSPQKPIIVAEFGVTDHNPLCDQAQWAVAALDDLNAGRWERVIGFSWWNERWQNDDDPVHDSILRVQDNPALQAVFQRLVGENPLILSEIATAPTQ